MKPLITSFGMVAIAEIEDNTQLLSFVLATRFLGQHWRVIAGIFFATILNHACAAVAGDWVAGDVTSELMHWILGLSFLGFAAWELVPDTLDDDDAKPSRFGAFLATVGSFFLAEMRDKTQLATVALGARYSSLTMVTIGTTLGMTVDNIPAVLMDENIAKGFSLSKTRSVAAAMFAVFGILILPMINFGLDLLASRAMD